MTPKFKAITTSGKWVEELGIYHKNPFHESEKWFHSRAEKRVFKNPLILRKNDPN